jgi:hypothetical protein
MSESNPQKSDAVLGGQNPPPLDAVVLGGLDGFTQRFASESLSAKLQLLKDIIKYGAVGIDLALQALSDPSAEVQRLARKLLRTQAGEEGKAALLDREPLGYFTTLSDWRWEIYNPEVGIIIDPANDAYVVKMTNSGSWSNRGNYDLSEFQSLIKDPRINELQVLIFQIDFNYYDESNTFTIALEAINNAKNLFPNLRGLFVGDSTGDRAPEYRKSKLQVSDIQSCLSGFPELEVLQVYGHFGEQTLACAEIKHEKLKTLIIETADIKQANIEQIAYMDMPNLEYFELWLGRWGNSSSEVVTALEPILSGATTPKLKYLGLCSDENTDSLISEVLKTTIISQLAVLDFKMGTMTDDGVELLINCPVIKDLKFLNVSGNYLSESAMAALGELPYQINTSNPHDLENEYNLSPEEYRHGALHE